MENVPRFVLTTLLLVWSSVAFSTGLWSIGATYFYTGRFTIESHHDVCEQPLNNRCVTHYKVRRPDGGLNDFVPFIYQFDPSYLVEGWTIVKNRLGFSYEINGVEKPWPYLWSRVEWTLLGIGGSFVWYFAGGLGALKGWLRALRRQVLSKA